jgi:hypothetical protein
MRKIFAAFGLLPVLIAIAAGCSSLAGGAGASEEGVSASGLGISARGAIGAVAADVMGPLYEGDGGAEIRLAVLAPEAMGAVPEYLPVYTQGLLNNNFKKYSGLTLIDRQNLDKIIAEQDLAANNRFSD